MDESQLAAGAGQIDPAALRIVDANRNRAAEGLRTVEDYCRFALGDRHLTDQCKNLRHDLARALSAVPELSLLLARETQQDVGTTLTTPDEGTRHSLAKIASASWHRVQQALRVIEECLKLSSSTAAVAVEGLRYRAYTLAKAAAVTADSQTRLAAARLYVLVDGGSSECAFVDRVQALIEAGVHLLQLRDKTLDDRTLLGRARLLRRAIDEAKSGPSAGPTGTVGLPTPLFIMNDRPDLAILARADGVHVGQEELPVHEVRQIVGPELLVGVSTHSLEQARQAVLDGASYIGCGPTFPSRTKAFEAFAGLSFLRQVAAEIALPAFAIGGITAQNLDAVLETGICRVAVSSGITNAADVHQAALTFCQALTRFQTPTLGDPSP